MRRHGGPSRLQSERLRPSLGGIPQFFHTTTTDNTNMKNTTKAALLGAAITALVVISFSPLFTANTKAADSASGEQYKVIYISDTRNPAVLEAELNKLGQEGWKVRTSLVVWVILAK